jgi:electron transfer flavoprotein alpha subunit
MAGVWIIGEHRDGAFRKITFEVASAAKTIADELGAEVTAVVLGQGMEDACKELGQYGVSKVLYADGEAFAKYTTDAYANAAAALIKDAAPDVVLLGASMQGKDLGGRLAAKLDTSIAVDCTGLAAADGRLKATRPMYAGKVFADVIIKSNPQMASLRPNVFDAVESGGEAVVESVSADAGELKTKVVEELKEAEGKIDLTEAAIIVSGGRGMKEAENFKIIEELAAVLGAAVGASRSAVDAGWRPHTDLVGQTGKVVTPNLYIACGISGAIQHLAGMGSSKVIAAINKDPDAPIHSKADFSVVADLFDVVPLLTEECKKLKEA